MWTLDFAAAIRSNRRRVTLGRYGRAARQVYKDWAGPHIAIKNLTSLWFSIPLALMANSRACRFPMYYGESLPLSLPGKDNEMVCA